MAGYIRQSTFVDGDTITAALFNNEYNQLVNAFSNTSGHKHDGTTAEGPVIGLIGDAGETSPNNKVLIDTTNNHIEFYVEVSSNPVQQIYIADGAIVPVTDSDVDLGTSSLYFKDAYIDSVTTTGNVSIGGNLTVTGNATISGNLTFGDADTDSINLAAEIDSNVIPNTDNTYDLGSSSKEWKDIYIDGTAYLDAINFNGTAITATAAELNILDGVTSTAAELNILDGVTSTTAELNILDGVTATAAEINLLDGVTSTTAELNILDGVTATAAEINTLDGITSTVAELNILDGVTASATDINLIDGITNGTVIASKAIVTDANKDISGGRNITITGELDAATLDISGNADIDGTLETDALSINGTTVTSTAAELNILDGVTSTAAELNILDGVTSTTAELNILDGVTATAAEINLLDGVTSTTAELNILDGVTSTAAELNILDGVTATTAELNILDGVTATTAELNILDGVTSTAAELNILDGKAFLDEDDMSSNSATGIASQQSIKAYVDATVAATNEVVEDSTPQLGGTLDTNGNLIQFGDSSGATDDRLQFGASQDLQIYHDASNSYIDDSGTGGLSIRSNLVQIGKYTGELSAQFVADGESNLYYDNSKKIATTSTGIDVTGTAVTDGLTVAGTAQITNTSSIDTLTLVGNTGSVAGVKLQAEEVHGAMYGVNIGTNYGGLAFHTNNNGTVAEKVRIDNAGNLLVGTTSNAPTTTAGINLGANNKLHATRSGGTSGYFNRLSSDGGIIEFAKDGTTVGSIGANDGHIYIAGQDGMGLRLLGSNVVPADGSGNSVNATKDLGGSLAKFRDLYLSGTAYADKVGIGTSSPKTNLDVVRGGTTGLSAVNARTVALFQNNSSAGSVISVNGPNTGYSGIFLGDPESEGQGQIKMVHTDNTMQFTASGSTSAMTIDSSGNVGIGHTSSFGKLSIDSNGQPASSGNMTTGLTISNGTAGTAINIGTYDAGGYSYIQSAYVNNAGVARDLVLLTGASERMRIDGSGNVGIGASSALDNKLEVNGGDIRVRGTSTPSIKLNNGSQEVVGIRLKSGATGALSFHTDKMLIDSSGNVGIGTTAPSTPLHIESTSSPQLRVAYNGSNYQDLNYEGSNIVGGSQTFKIAGSEKMRLDTSGRLGIGTTSPDELLHVKKSSGTTMVKTEVNAGSVVGFNIKKTGTTNQEWKIVDGQTVNGRLEIYDVTDSRSVMTFDGDGGVGIGTTSVFSGNKLDVQGGNIMVGGFNSGTEYGLILTPSNSSTYWNVANITGGHLTFNNSATIGSSEKARIDVNGNLLVGSTVTTLYASGSGGATGVQLVPNGASAIARNGGVLLYMNRTNTDGDTLVFRKNGATVGSVSVTSSATTYNTSSDARLKDVTGEARGLDVINALNPVSYNWKADGKADEGLIAQEVLDVVPNAVSQNEEYYQMDYSKLVVHLVKAVKEQQTQIEALQSEINLLKGE